MFSLKFRHLLAILPCTILTALPTTTARAVDGVIEINQTRALAGGVTAGDTPGFPVTISAAGSYRLTGNLDVTGLPQPENIWAVEITSSDVDLDLNGFSIIGPTDCSGMPKVCSPVGSGEGVSAGGQRRVAVRNGRVRGFGHAGIRLGPQGVVEEVHVMDNSSFGVAVELSGRIVSNTIEENGINGITCGQGSFISGNALHRNGNDGIGTTESLISNNVVMLNGGAGISDARASLVTGNTVLSNTGLGLNLGQASAYGNNSIDGNNGGNANPQVANGTQIATNMCGGDTICP